MMKIYNEVVWNEYVEKVEHNFQLKTYPQFDPYFDFQKDKALLKAIVSDPTFQKIKSHPFLPFLKVLIKTPRYRYQVGEDNYDLETKIRPISYASHFDAYLYGFYAFSLNKIYQDYIIKHGFDEVVLAYRSDLGGKCNIQFAKETFDLIKGKYTNEDECSVIALDIKGYFDNINHSKLKEQWCKIIGQDELPPDQYHVFRSLTKYSYVNYTSYLKHFDINLKKLKKKQRKKFKDKKKVSKGFNSLLDLLPEPYTRLSFNEKMNLLRKKKLITVNSEYDKAQRKRIFKKRGIPQGSSLSALLSNIYLAEFDSLICAKGKEEGFIYRRYCDDILVICKPEQVNDLKNYLMRIISKEYKLTIQDKKTEIIDFKPYRDSVIRAFKRNYNETDETFDSLSNDEKNFKNLQYLGFEYNGKNIYIRSGSLSRYFRKLKARIVKTISMAYSDNSKSDTIFKQQIYSRYSHLGKRNFLTYAYNSSKNYYLNSAGIKKSGMNSPSIKRQVAAHMRILNKEIQKTSAQRAMQKKLSK